MDHGNSLYIREKWFARWDRKILINVRLNELNASLRFCYTIYVTFEFYLFELQLLERRFNQCLIKRTLVDRTKNHGGN